MVQPREKFGVVEPVDLAAHAPGALDEAGKAAQAEEPRGIDDERGIGAPLVLRANGQLGVDPVRRELERA